MKKRTPEQVKTIRSMLRRNRSYREDKYNSGGTLKASTLAPKVTLPKLKFMEKANPYEND